MTVNEKTKMTAVEEINNVLMTYLSCKVGDTVYVPTRDFVSSFVIEKVTVFKDNLFFHWRLFCGMYPGSTSNCYINGFTPEAIGKGVFLTEEEAREKIEKGE
jgi:hypothetical protein